MSGPVLQRVMLPRLQLLRLPFALAWAAMAIATVLGAHAAQAQTKIVAGMVAHGPPQWPQYIAEEFGWLKQDKIELDFIAVGSGGAQQLAGGSLNIAHSGYPDFARAALQGAGERIIINDFIGSPYAIFAKPSIKAIADLKGKLLSIGGVNDITLIYIKPFLASAGLKTSDVDFVYAKAAGDRFSALLSGGVDATILNPPTYFKAISQGFSNLGDTKPFAEGVPFTVWAANAAWAAQHRELLIAFARNYKRAVRWLYDPANKQQAIDILVKHAHQDPKDSSEAYDYLVAKLRLFGPDGDVSDTTYERMAEGLEEIGTLKKPFPPKSAIFDGSFVEAATN
jgi:ABC-type nitrate/sulfonate/bicarbonate transport system substrate-binding protein